MPEKIYITAEEIQSNYCMKEFQETAINFYRTGDEAEIFTTDPTMITKLKNIMLRDPDSYRCYYYKNNVDRISGKPIGYTFICNKSLISFRIASDKRELSDEEKVEVAKRLSRKTN